VSIKDLPAQRFGRRESRPEREGTVFTHRPEKSASASSARAANNSICLACSDDATAIASLRL